MNELDGRPSEKGAVAVLKTPAEREAALRLLSEGRVCRLGYWYDGRPFVIPMNFVFLNGAIFLHTGLQKQKLKAVDSIPEVCIQIDDIAGMIKGLNPCDYSYSFSSVVIHGKAARIHSPGITREALSAFSLKYTGKSYTFTEAQLTSVVVLNVPLETISVKLKNMGAAF